MTGKKPTTNAFDRLLAQYDYEFPESAVALEPSEPRDAARLLVHDPSRGEPNYSTFAHLVEFLPPRSVLVLNETKVLPARIEVTKPTGGRVRLLYVGDDVRWTFRALADRPIAAGDKFSVGSHRIRSEGRVENGHVFSFVGRKVKPLALFMRYGKTPIPPYLKHTKLDEKMLRVRYQTVFAKRIGSVAAPTASLHFTKPLLRKIHDAGHDIAYVTLHVNLGTFAPLTPGALVEGRLHEERYLIDKKTIAFLSKAKKEGRPIISVGTTALRALESACDGHGKLRWPDCVTRLFIRPGYRFCFVDGLITNFHVPKSSLLMLVSALVGRAKLLALYKDAIAKGFRIFSFGDGMLLLQKKRPLAKKIRCRRPAFPHDARACPRGRVRRSSQPCLLAGKG